MKIHFRKTAAMAAILILCSSVLPAAASAPSGDIVESADEIAEPVAKPAEDSGEGTCFDEDASIPFVIEEVTKEEFLEALKEPVKEETEEADASIEDAAEADAEKADASKEDAAEADDEKADVSKEEAAEADAEKADVSYIFENNVLEIESGYWRVYTTQQTDSRIVISGDAGIILGGTEIISQEGAAITIAPGVTAQIVLEGGSVSYLVGAAGSPALVIDIAEGNEDDKEEPANEDDTEESVKVEESIKTEEGKDALLEAKEAKEAAETAKTEEAKETEEAEEPSKPLTIYGCGFLTLEGGTGAKAVSGDWENRTWEDPEDEGTEFQGIERIALIDNTEEEGTKTDTADTSEKAQEKAEDTEKTGETEEDTQAKDAKAQKVEDEKVIEAAKNISFSVQVKWDDDQNVDALRPDLITVNLYADGEDSGRTVVLHQDNDWTAEFDGLPASKDGKLVSYSVTEDSVGGYLGSISGSTEDGYVIVNVHTPNPTGRSASEEVSRITKNAAEQNHTPTVTTYTTNKVATTTANYSNTARSAAVQGAKTQSPKTLDSGKPELWAILMIIGIAGLYFWMRRQEK